MLTGPVRHALHGDRREITSTGRESNRALVIHRGARELQCLRGAIESGERLEHLRGDCEAVENVGSGIVRVDQSEHEIRPIINGGRVEVRDRLERSVFS